MSQRGRVSKKASELLNKGGNKGEELTAANTSSSTVQDFSKLSANELISAVLERNKDPVIEQMLFALISKLPQEMSVGTH